MPKFSSVDAAFTRTPQGWTFKSRYPRMFGQPSTYLLTDAEKAALEERLNRVMLRALVLAFILLVFCVFALLMVRDFVLRLGADTLEAELLRWIVSIVIASVLIPVLFFMRHRAVQPVLRTARRIGPA